MYSAEQEPRIVIPLSGVWEFEQTLDAFPPARFTRKVPVPGLIFLAEPRIDQYDAYCDGSHKPRYNWYRRRFVIPESAKGMNGVVTILKSQYVTDVFLNGHHLGGSMSCYTPVEFDLGDRARIGEENELLIRLGDRKWLPTQAAGSIDREKRTYWPGIWDEVEVSFSGAFRVDRWLLLPKASAGEVEVKIDVRSYLQPKFGAGHENWDSCLVDISIFEEKNGAKAVGSSRVKVPVNGDNRTRIDLNIPIQNTHYWSPDNPFLYRAEISLLGPAGKVSDKLSSRFGMRDFDRQGRHFTLNGERIYLRGSNITLHRFFEDPECKALPWDKDWVRKLLSEIPRRQNWNSMRVCVGIAPSFWYQIADSCGLLLQNEWLYWQTHGWNEQISREYADWVWADGNHPSIVIWDAINENWNDYVGQELIPELKELDPTRIWDAGFMTGRDMGLDEMDEPHPYMVFSHRDGYEDRPGDPPYPLGDLNYAPPLYWPPRWDSISSSGAAQLINEYGWVWLWRDGTPSKLTKEVFEYYLGADASKDQCRQFQAYWLQLQTEWLRSERSLAGVMAFSYLTNDRGFTGDWFTSPVSRLNGTPTLEWLKHCFAPVAVFIDLVDTRYIKGMTVNEPGGTLSFNLVGINDLNAPSGGQVTLRLLDRKGSELLEETREIEIPAFGKKLIPLSIKLPQTPGGYLLLAELNRPGISPVVSRRYICVGEPTKGLSYYELEPPR